MTEYGVSLRDGQLVVSCPECRGGFSVVRDEPLPTQIQQFTESHSCRLIPVQRTPLHLVKPLSATS